MAVEVRVLGEVDALVDAQPVDLGHLRQRCVLAVLAAEAGRVMPSDQLIERVWGVRPPASARNSLYSYLARLRHALHCAGAVIEHRAGGYVLALDPAQVDLYRFRGLLVRARAAGDDADGSALFDRALGLWRGEAFAGLDTPWLNGVRASAEQERRAAELDQADLRLRRGEHAQLVPELSARAGRYPLDERLACQLMLACYRSGRQAEAIAVFDGIRARLAEELGVAPVPELREMFERIVHGDS